MQELLYDVIYNILKSFQEILFTDIHLIRDRNEIVIT